MSTNDSEKTKRRGALRVIRRIAAPAFLLLLADVSISAEPPREVVITNFPEQQEVRGTVTVDATIPHARMVRFEDHVVTPVSRSEYTNLQEIGALDSDGFSSAVLSLTGEVKGSGAAGGRIGVLLIPDEEPILRAFRDRGEILLAIELEAELEAGSTRVFAGQATQEIGFPRYRVFFFNEGGSSVSASAYVYLRH